MDFSIDLVKMSVMSLGLLYFIYQMLSDVYLSLVSTPARHWIPLKSLVLSALTIQILTYLQNNTDTLSNEPDLREAALWISNELTSKWGRVVICVFIGYLLPGMARAGSAGDWRTLTALVLGLFIAAFSEFYHVPKIVPLFIRNSEYHPLDKLFFEINQKAFSKLWFIVAKVVVLGSIMLLILFSVSAILAGKTIRGMLSHRISAIQRKSEEESENSWEKFEGEIVRSWFLARVCQPQHVIARSVLSSAAGLVIAILILFLVVKQIVYKSGIFYERYDGLDWLRRIEMFLEWIFILIAGTIIFSRWFTAVSYFPRFFVKEKKPLQCRRHFVEDYWIRSIIELIQMYKLQKWRLQELSKDHGISDGLVLRMAITMNLHNLLYLFWPLQISIICFSKCCLFISELLFRFKFVSMYLVGSDKLSSYPTHLTDSFHGNEEFLKYREVLEQVCLPGENPASLWVSNEKSMKQVKAYFNESKKKGCNCEDLIALIRTQFHQKSFGGVRFVDQLKVLPIVAEQFPALDENCMRMTALSLLNIIIILLPLNKDVDALAKAMEAYRQALDLMTFVESSDPQQPNTVDVLKVIDIEADRVSVAAYNEFQRLPNLHKQVLNSLDKSHTVDVHTGREAIKKLLKEAEKQLKVQKLLMMADTRQDQSVEGEGEEVSAEYCCESQDSKDWSAIPAIYSTYRVFELILRRSHSNVNELVDDLYSSLANVIANCLLELPDALLKSCGDWAVQFEEDKIWEAIYIAGKAMGVLQEKCNTEPILVSEETKLPYDIEMGVNV